MTPEREIEILKMLKERILKVGMEQGLCYEIFILNIDGTISFDEWDYLKSKIKKWTRWTWYSFFGLRSQFAAPPGEITPRIEYIDNRIKELDRYI